MNLIDGEKLLAKIRKRRSDINDMIDYFNYDSNKYFDLADFELKWIEEYIVKEIENLIKIDKNGKHK